MRPQFPGTNNHAKINRHKTECHKFVVPRNVCCSLMASFSFSSSNLFQCQTGVKICLLRLFVLWLGSLSAPLPFFFRSGLLSFPLFTSLKRCLPFCKLFARNFHFKRLYCLIQYFLYLGGYLLTTGQIYGFFAALPTVCSLSHINGKTPALFSGAFMPYFSYINHIGRMVMYAYVSFSQTDQLRAYNSHALPVLPSVFGFG